MSGYDQKAAGFNLRHYRKFPLIDIPQGGPRRARAILRDPLTEEPRMTGGEVFFLSLATGAVLVMFVALLIQGLPYIKGRDPS
jgi:hypothetical protein